MRGGANEGQLLTGGTARVGGTDVAATGSGRCSIPLSRGGAGTGARREQHGVAARVYDRWGQTPRNRDVIDVRERRVGAEAGATWRG